eukprot:280574-Rhodomonas_salina.1
MRFPGSDIACGGASGLDGDQVLDPASRIAELESRLPFLSGQANKFERSRVSKEIRDLRSQLEGDQ